MVAILCLAPTSCSRKEGISIGYGAAGQLTGEKNQFARVGDKFLVECTAVEQSARMYSGWFNARDELT